MCAPKLHSCFLERSRQQEATVPPVLPTAACACCCVAAHAGYVRWVSPTEHRRAAPTRAAAVGVTHGGALHSPPRRQRVPGTSAASGGTLCGQARRQLLAFRSRNGSTILYWKQLLANLKAGVRRYLPRSNAYPRSLLNCMIDVYTIRNK
jgi:hypothetical protein